MWFSCPFQAVLFVSCCRLWNGNCPIAIYCHLDKGSLSTALQIFTQLCRWIFWQMQMLDDNCFLTQNVCYLMGVYQQCCNNSSHYFLWLDLTRGSCLKGLNLTQVTLVNIGALGNKNKYFYVYQILAEARLTKRCVWLHKLYMTIRVISTDCHNGIGNFIADWLSHFIEV